MALAIYINLPLTTGASHNHEAQAAAAANPGRCHIQLAVCEDMLWEVDTDHVKCLAL